MVTPSQLKDVVWPKEHGSWSLALEPLALGLLTAPSIGGIGLALAGIAAFFARRPLRIAWREQQSTRRTDAVVALALCGAVASSSIAGSILIGGFAWLIWLVPPALLSAVFVAFVLQNEGRAELAEVAGAAAFGCLPAAFVILAGGTTAGALAVSALMLARTLPAVLGVRAYLRGVKTGIWRRAPIVVVTGGVLVTALALYRGQLVASPPTLLVSVLSVGLALVIVIGWRGVRARALGMAEAAAGIVFVAVAAVSLSGAQALRAKPHAVRSRMPRIHVAVMYLGAESWLPRQRLSPHVSTDVSLDLRQGAPTPSPVLLAQPTDL